MLKEVKIDGEKEENKNFVYIDINGQQTFLSYNEALDMALNILGQIRLINECTDSKVKHKEHIPEKKGAD